MLQLADIEKAKARIGGTVLHTPLVPCHAGFHNLFLKLDNLQVTGSFKERGALNKIKILKEQGTYHGIIGASAGNHAQAVAYHGVKQGFSVDMIMPKHTPTVKLNATEKWGATVELRGETVDEGMEIARRVSKEKNLAFVPAFDDEDIIAGQGTLSLEILQDLPEIECVLVPVGGGGLASGMALAIKSLRPNCKIIGVQTEMYPQVTYAYRNQPFEKPKVLGPTIADGIAVKGIGHFTLPLLRTYLDDMISVSDEDIADALLFLLQQKKTLAEGAGAAAFAAVLSNKFDIRGFGSVCAVVSGGNVDMNLLSRIIEKEFLKMKRLLKVNVIISDRPGSLHHLTGLLKDLNVNILQIEHDRVSTSIPYYNTGTNLLLETRGEDHYNQVLRELKNHAYRVEVFS